MAVDHSYRYEEINYFGRNFQTEDKSPSIFEALSVVKVSENEYTAGFDIETGSFKISNNITDIFNCDKYGFDQSVNLRLDSNNNSITNNNVITKGTEKGIDSNNNVIRGVAEEGTKSKRKVIEIIDEGLYLETSEKGKDNIDFGIKNQLKLHKNTNTRVPFKISVIGNKGAGKTSLVQALLSSNGIADDQSKVNEINGITINTLLKEDKHLKIFDIAHDLDSFESHSIFMTDNTLYLLCFDVKEFAVFSENIKAISDLENWLRLISAKAPNSRVIIVATNIDSHVANKHFMREVRASISSIYDRNREKHREHFGSKKLHDCLICQKSSAEIQRKPLQSVDVHKNSAETLTLSSSYPHIVGYYEISSKFQIPTMLHSFKNKSIRKLRKRVISVSREMVSPFSCIPEKWKFVQQKILELDKNIINFNDLVENLKNCTEEEIVAATNFYHKNGEILIFSSKDNSCKTIISNIAWLCNQLKSLCNLNENLPKGFISDDQFKYLFQELADKERRNLLFLLKKTGYVIEVDDTKFMVPSSLPFGMPNLDQWPLNHDKKQINFLFHFDDLPKSFFPHLISNIENLHSSTFTGKMKQIYTGNNIVYNAISTNKTCEYHSAERDTMYSSFEIIEDNYESGTVDEIHRVNFKLFQEKDEIILSVVGPHPCCIANELIELLEKVKNQNFKHIRMSHFILCGKCIHKGYLDPCYFTSEDMSSTHPICEKGHNLKNWENVKRGISMLPEHVTLKSIVDARNDSECPKLFVITPSNKENYLLSIYNEYVLQFLCEYPGSWHVTGTIYEMKSPGVFVKKYGRRLCSLLTILSNLETPLRLSVIGGDIADSFEELGKIASKVENYLHDFKEEYCFGEKLTQKSSIEYLSADDNKLSWRELSSFVKTLDENQRFKDLYPTLIGNKIYWLCKGHSKLYQDCM